MYTAGQNAGVVAAAVAAGQNQTQVYVTDSCLQKPYRCPHPKIQFYLYTRRTQEQPEFIDVLDANALYYTHFNPGHPTKIIIHGFGGGRTLSPSPDLREAYFSVGEYNIIIVDYADAVKEPCLSQMDWALDLAACASPSWSSTSLDIPEEFSQMICTLLAIVWVPT